MRKKPSFRAIARMKKELRDAKEKLREISTSSYPGTIISRISLGPTSWPEVKTAHRLGFVLVVRENSEEKETIALHAVRKADL